jgi:hypothetical protein
MATTTATQPADTAPVTDTKKMVSQMQAHPPIINLGKVKAKHAKKLKKGRIGVMSNELMQSFQQMSAGMEGKQVPVFISYEAKPRTKPKKKKKVNFMGLNIDRKKFKKSLKKNGIGANFF